MQHPDYNKAQTRHRKSETDFWGYEYLGDALTPLHKKHKTLPTEKFYVIHEPFYIFCVGILFWSLTGSKLFIYLDV